MRARARWITTPAIQRSLRALLTVLALCCADSSSALDPRTPFVDYPMNHWATTDGLPSTAVLAITQDHDGYLWITWATGLARFDGLHFESFSRRQVGVVGTDLRGAYCDRRGRLWFSSIHGLLLRENDRFVTVDHTPERSVVGVVELDDGTVLAATNVGVMHYVDGHLEPYKGNTFLARSIVRTRDHVLVGGVGMLQRIDGDDTQIIALPPSHQSARVESIQIQADTIWLGTSRGLLRLRQGEVTSPQLQGAAAVFSPETPDLDTTQILALRSDRQGNLWISTAARLFRLKPDGVLEAITDDPFARSPYIFSSFEDRAGSLWIGSRYYGLFAFSDGWARRLDDRNGLTDPLVWSVVRDRSGGILFGTHTNVTRLFQGKLETLIDGEALRNRAAFELAVDSNAHLWVGTRAGAAVFDGRRDITPPALAALDQVQVFAIVEQPDGAMWLGTAQGLYRYAAGELRRAGASANEGATANIRAILVNANDDLLIGTAAGIRTLRQDLWQEPAWARPLSDANISSFNRVHDDLMVIATRDSGIGLLTDDKLLLLGTDQGLPTDNTWHSQVDGDYLYVAGSDGLWRTLLSALPDPRARDRRVQLRTERVLTGEECCNSGGQARAAADETGIWFIGTRGAMHVDTRAIVPTAETNAVALIEGMLHDGQLIPGTRPIVLSEGSRDVELRFTSIEFRNPRSLRFRYQLQGYDSQWRTTDIRRNASYTNLPAGSYRFNVLLDGRGVGGNVATLEFSMLPRWYERTGVHIALVIALLLLVALAQLRMGRLYNRRRRVLQSLVDERTSELSSAIASQQSINEQLRTEVDERLAAERELQNRNHDLTEVNVLLENTQNQLLQSEKMASIGQLAAGVAHEINNPIGFVQSNLNTLRRYVADLLELQGAYDSALEPHQRAAVDAMLNRIDLPFLKEDLPILLDQSADGVTRVVKIVRDLKDFSHVDEPDWQQVDVHDCIESTLNLANHELKYKVKVVKDYGVLPKITCMPFQLNQVLMNLFINAANAIAVRGVLTIRTAAEGDGVLIEIGDTGSGIPRAVLHRIFEPFFTTKPIGQGTGLGLSVSYGIVRKHGGTIDVASVEGQGTTFSLRLPVTPPQVQRGGQAAEVENRV